VEIGDTRLWVEERGGGFALLVLHGGPGLDHHEFADYLDPLVPLGVRLLLVDQRAQGRSDPAPPDTWTPAQMAADVTGLARALELDRYAVLGHSFGAFVALQHAVFFSGEAARTVVSSGVPSARFLEHVERSLETFEPVELREQVARSWEREAGVETAGELADLLHDQLPFHFRDPLDPRIADYERRTAGAVLAPAVLRHFAGAGYGAVEVEDKLGRILQPVLVRAGRHDRACSIGAAETMALGIPHAELRVFEESAHMTFVEETEAYLDAVGTFLAPQL
jgi:proline iminopeptidase